MPACSNLAEWQVMGPKALKGGRDERLRRRKEPQQAPSAQGKQVMRSAAGANLLHSVRCPAVVAAARAAAAAVQAGWDAPLP